MTYYKVLYNMRSCVITQGDEARVSYVENEWVRPNDHCGPLAVFETKVDAINFIQSNFWEDDALWISLWECEIKKSKKVKLYKPRWYRRYETMYERHLCNLPGGTVLAEAVKITKQVEI